jgi:hypothetical protein
MTEKWDKIVINSLLKVDSITLKQKFHTQKRLENKIIARTTKIFSYFFAQKVCQ